MYEQTLYKIVEPIKKTVISRMNRTRKWKYGYDKEHDIVVISKTGKIGEIYEIYGFRIALPLAPKKVHSLSGVTKEQKWSVIELPKELSKIKSVIEWDSYPDSFKEHWVEYIDEEFRRREEGFWFKNKGVDTYVTGANYMYLQWAKTDIGHPDFRESNRLYHLFWEGCKADNRCYGICYLKNRRSGFSFQASNELVNLATITSDSRYGILSKTGPDAKKMFTDKVVPISAGYPFFFKPVQDGMDRPKTELSYKIPASKLTKKKMQFDNKSQKEERKGLDTTIDWKNTGNNSYDGEKLRLLVHDESGKWEKPNNLLDNWRVTKTCLRLGKRITGKCMMGSTSNALDRGGENFRKQFFASDVNKRNKNGQTASGLYSLFIPMEWNFEGFIDEYGWPVFDTPTEKVYGPDGEIIDEGVISYWENEVDGLKDDQDGLNEYYRQFPRTVDHAFRDETKGSLFNLTKIYEQIDYNAGHTNTSTVTRGNFEWEHGIKDTKVTWVPNKNGRFNVSWIPEVSLQNNVVVKNGEKYPGNELLGAFGCDSYDISGTVDGSGSNGALHGLTTYNLIVPTNHFFLDYVCRPPTAEIFFEDVLMALIFYGMPMLAENNKPRLLYYLKRRGYRGYSINRPDKHWHSLSITEKEIGGVPNSSEDMKQAHAAAIESYIDTNLGTREDGSYGSLFFNSVLYDWAKFDINNRTKFDAAISSGLAIMACNKHRYKPTKLKKKTKIKINIATYSNSGGISKIRKT